MKKKLILLMLICLGFVGLTLVILLSSTKLPNMQNNGFSRRWLNEIEDPIKQNIINPLITKISGGTDYHLYFSGNDPRWVIMTDYSLNIIDTLVYGIELSGKLRAPGITVDSPHIYMYAGEISYFFTGLVQQPKIDTVRIKTDLITRFAQLSPDRMIIRGIDSTQSKQIFKLINCNTGEVLKEVDLIKEQQFGGFDSDGFLEYDKSTQRVCYLQMFQNKFFCLDSNLNILFTAHTIDTTYNNQVLINLVNNGGETKVMATKPRQIVNQEMCTNYGHLFVLSGLRADNENLQDFNKHSTIDMYQLKDGIYQGSFTIPRVKGKKASKIMVINQQIVVLYKDGIVATYKIPSNIINKLHS